MKFPKIDEVPDLILGVAQYVAEEDWDDVFQLLLDMNEISYKRGYLQAVELAELYKTKI